MMGEDLAPLSSLLRVDDRLWAYLELEKDPVFPHLSPEGRRQYVDVALRAGAEAARPYQGMAVADVAAMVGARIDVAAGTSCPAGITIRAEYQPASRLIRVYQRPATLLADFLSRLEPGAWIFARVLAMLAAHELFHHLEESRLGPVDRQLPAVTTLRVGRWPLRSLRARRCREIAAYAFAKALPDLPFLPVAAEWLLLVEQGTFSAAALSEALQRAQADMA